MGIMTTGRTAVLLGTVLLMTSASAAADPIVWNGPRIAFTKPDFADWTLATNQDRVTNDVWLTRADTLPLFNIAVEPAAIGGSPTGTEWAFGPTQPGNHGPISASNHANLEFGSFVSALDGAIGRNVVRFGPGVLHLISSDIYLDITFTSWTKEVGGGGFSYLRSTPTPSAVPEPASVALLVVGAAATAAARRRKIADHRPQ
jgi:hypothetical protein